MVYFQSLSVSGARVRDLFTVLLHHANVHDHKVERGTTMHQSIQYNMNQWRRLITTVLYHTQLGYGTRQCKDLSFAALIKYPGRYNNTVGSWCLEVPDMVSRHIVQFYLGFVICDHQPNLQYLTSCIVVIVFIDIYIIIFYIIHNFWEQPRSKSLEAYPKYKILLEKSPGRIKSTFGGLPPPPPPPPITVVAFVLVGRWRGHCRL